MTNTSRAVTPAVQTPRRAVRFDSTKTTLPTTNNYQRTWYVIDAATMPLGRLASKVAFLLMGKNRADYTPAVDMGSCVVILNSDKLFMTGKKMEKKVYFRHKNGTLGGLKHRTIQQQMALDSTRPVYLAVKRMLPKNRHQDIFMNTRLKIVKNEKHGLTQKMVTVTPEVVV
jgi:large subunit ribosomal protein L13